MSNPSRPGGTPMTTTEPVLDTTPAPTPDTGRVQLALNVDSLDEAVAFYTALLGTPPAKLRPGYANFAVARPPLKLVLLENPGQGGSLDDLLLRHAGQGLGHRPWRRALGGLHGARRQPRLRHRSEQRDGRGRDLLRN